MLKGLLRWEQDRMRTVFYLMTHKNERQIKRLVKHLRSFGNAFVLVHHDASSPVLTLPASSDVCLIDDPVRVRWGGFSQVEMMSKGIDWLEATRTEFDWLIILSGQDYPAMPVAQIETELRDTQFDAFVDNELIHEDPARHTNNFQAVCMRRYFMRTIRIPGVRRFHFRRTHPYSEAFQCYAGSNWLNLSRKAVEVLWSMKAERASLARHLRHAPCPDETFFQTLLFNGSSLNIQSWDRRFYMWREDASNPEILGIDDLDRIRASGAWFARKVDDTVDTELLDRLDSVAAGREILPSVDAVPLRSPGP
jgi:hypothetical protein